MGRIRILNQFDSNARSSVDVDWKIFTPSVYCLFYCE